jgi:hypothetical protein
MGEIQIKAHMPSFSSSLFELARSFVLLDTTNYHLGSGEDIVIQINMEEYNRIIKRQEQGERADFL